jgi:hypothetical protein
MAYRNDGRPKDLAIDPEDVLAAQRRSRKKTLLLLGVCVGLIAVGGGGAAIAVGRQAQSATQHAWDRAATCVTGALADGPSPSTLVRNSQLIAMSAPAEARLHLGPGVDEFWPLRCSAPLHAFVEAVKNGGGSANLEEASDKLARALSVDSSVTADLGPLVEKLFSAAAAERLSAHPLAEVTGPPKPAAPLTLATLPKDARVFGAALTLAGIHRAPFADDPLRFVVDDKDFPEGPAICELAEGERVIACTKVPPPAAGLSPALRLWGTTAPKVKPFVFAGDRGKSGIFRSDTGERVVDRLEYGAYGATALDDGSLGYLAWHDKLAETHFVRVARDGSRSESVVVSRKESGNPYYSSSIFWSYVAYKSVRKDADGIRLVVREIGRDGALGAPLDIGRIEEVGQIEGGESEEPHLTGCRSGDTTVIRAKGWRNTFVSFLVGGNWTAPVEAPGLGGQLECRSGEAIVSRVWGGPMGSTFKGGVGMYRCTASGCDDRSVNLNKVLADNKDVLPREAREVRAVDIDGKLLLVWSAGERGGLRTRFAISGELASVPDTILYDDHIRDGAFREESTIVDFELFPTAHGALFLLGTVEGVFAYLFDANGKPQPVAAKL